MFDRIEMTPEMARAHILGSIEGDADALTNLIAAVITWANCREADVSPDGNIWIAGPQRGHWLSDDKLVQFINWTEKR
ncbi:MAG: hypothetical protein IT537_03320 [Hyphomicrobiales bacterium]|nr:hypothetical protein [Hyphomicrobiales bacterium]